MQLMELSECDAQCLAYSIKSMLLPAASHYLFLTKQLIQSQQNLAYLKMNVNKHSNTRLSRLGIEPETFNI